MENDMMGIFNRDQRTIKNRKGSETHISVDSYQFCRDCKLGRQTRSFSLTRLPVLFFRISNFGMDTVIGRPVKNYTKTHEKNRKFTNYNNFIKRLVHVLIIGVLLSILRIPTVMSAPCKIGSKRPNSVPKWWNPCGLDVYGDNASYGSTSSCETDRELIEPILTAAKIAQDYMRKFKDAYAKETFQVPKTHVLRWLPNREEEVPKNPGEKVSTTLLKCQRLDIFLKSIYQSMQKYAVGIEQIVWDQEKGGKFYQQFLQTESNLIKVLCEIQSAMASRNIKPLPLVDRCIMDEQTRKMNDVAQRNLRDWIILREFYNAIEYLIQVLEYFDATLPS